MGRNGLNKEEEALGLLQHKRRMGVQALDEHEGKRLLAHFGLTVPKGVKVGTAEEVIDLAQGLCSPYVVKALSSEALHKSDLGAVRLNLPDIPAVKQALSEIESVWPLDKSIIEGYLVEEMAKAGHELVVGGFMDAQFGPMLMVGLGGVFVEVFSDISFRVCPITKKDAHAMLRELKAYPILQGARGQASADEEAIIEVLLKVGGAEGLLMKCATQIQELDINPLIVNQTGVIAVDARVVLKKELTLAEEKPVIYQNFEPLFAPKNVAVVGVSSTGEAAGNRFIHNLNALGYTGHIYPIHPKSDRIEGLKAYHQISEIPEPIDYMYIAVPKKGVYELLEQAKNKVKFAQIMSSGFTEEGTGPESQAALKDVAFRGGIRLLGPNCLGTYSPRGKITFTPTKQYENATGTIGVISQSGGFGVDFVRTGQARGLRFSSVVTIGNSIDIDANDLLAHYIVDPHTSIVGMYLEDIKDGRRLFELLNQAKGKKPIVLLKGGRTSQGRKAAASHTGSLAGDARVWQAVASQTGCLLANSIEELMDTLLLLQLLKVRPKAGSITKTVALFGNGGGASVVAADTLAQSGLSLAVFTDDTRSRLEGLNLPAGASGENPIDLPANAFNRTEGNVAVDVLKVLAKDTSTSTILVHLNLPVLLSYTHSPMVKNIVQACINYQASASFESPRLVLILRTDNTLETDKLRSEYTQLALASGVPVFSEFYSAARALKMFADYEALVHGET